MKQLKINQSLKKEQIIIIKKVWITIIKLNKKKQEDKRQLKEDQIVIRKEIIKTIVVNWIMMMMRIYNIIKLNQITKKAYHKHMKKTKISHDYTI